jgi:hypothetical protein
MAASDNLFTVLSIASMAVAFAAPAWLLFTSLLHWLMVGVRKLRRQPGRLEWWVGGRLLAVLGVIAALLASGSYGIEGCSRASSLMPRLLHAIRRSRRRAHAALEPSA